MAKRSSSSRGKTATRGKAAVSGDDRGPASTRRVQRRHGVSEQTARDVAAAQTTRRTATAGPARTDEAAARDEGLTRTQSAGRRPVTDQDADRKAPGLARRGAKRSRA